MSRFRCAATTLFLCMILAGCGHDVSPTEGFREAASIPLCCVTDTQGACCGLGAFGFSQGVNLSWFSEDGVFAYIDGWIIYRAEGESPPADGDYRRINNALFTESTLVDGGVTDGRTYWYRLASVSPAGVESVPTSPVSVRVDMTAPAPPSGLSAVPVAGRIELSWDSSLEPDLSHYNIFREPPEPALVLGPIPSDAVTYEDTQVQSGTTYRYWMTAVDFGINESAPGDTVEVFFP